MFEKKATCSSRSFSILSSSLLLRLPRFLFPSGFFTEFSPLPHKFHVFSPSYLSGFLRPKIIFWEAKITKLLTIQFSLILFIGFPLDLSIFLSSTSFKTPNLCCFLNVKKTSSTPTYQNRHFRRELRTQNKCMNVQFQFFFSVIHTTVTDIPT